jgi:hypothetical protein
LGKNRCRKLCRAKRENGENAILYPNVTILDECTIGKILYYGLGQWSENVVTLVQMHYTSNAVMEQMDLDFAPALKEVWSKYLR